MKRKQKTVGGGAWPVPGKNDRLRPFRRYTSLRRFKKANPFPYSSRGWSVWDEIDAQKEANREAAKCGWSYSEMMRRAAWETI